MKRAIVIVASAFVVAAGHTQVAQGPAELGWLTGCWQLERGAVTIHEFWTPMRGGLMAGVSHTVRNDSTIGHETMRIERTAVGLSFTAEPRGQAPTVFNATSSEAPLVFENPAHDFPQRVIYRPQGNDSLMARIEGLQNGQVRGVDFPYGRVSCT